VTDSDHPTNHVPTEGEDELLGTLEEIERTGKAPCRLCDELVEVSEAESWGDVFEALAEHGEEAHEWNDREGWSR